MKTAMKVFGIICAVIGGIVMMSYAIVSFMWGPRKAWRLLKDSFDFGQNYEF